MHLMPINSSPQHFQNEIHRNIWFVNHLYLHHHLVLRATSKKSLNCLERKINLTHCCRQTCIEVRSLVSPIKNRLRGDLGRCGFRGWGGYYLANTEAGRGLNRPRGSGPAPENESLSLWPSLIIRGHGHAHDNDKISFLYKISLLGTFVFVDRVLLYLPIRPFIFLNQVLLYFSSNSFCICGQWRLWPQPRSRRRLCLHLLARGQCLIYNFFSMMMTRRRKIMVMVMVMPEMYHLHHHHHDNWPNYAPPTTSPIFGKF